MKTIKVYEFNELSKDVQTKILRDFEFPLDLIENEIERQCTKILLENGINKPIIYTEYECEDGEIFDEIYYEATVLLSNLVKHLQLSDKNLTKVNKILADNINLEVYFSRNESIIYGNNSKFIDTLTDIIEDFKFSINEQLQYCKDATIEHYKTDESKILYFNKNTIYFFSNKEVIKWDN